MILRIGIILLSGMLSVNAQNIPSSFHPVTTFEGLPSNAVCAIIKDSIGFIWIATKMGLCRYDGCEIKKYKELGESDIWSIEELNKDTLLIGTVSDLKIYNRRTKAVSVMDMPFTMIRAIKKIDNSRFFIGTEAGLYLASGNRIQKIIFDTGLSSSNCIKSICKENDDTYWFSTTDGLGKIDLKTFRTSVFKMGKGVQNSNYFNCLVRVNKDIYLGSFNKGVFRFNINTRQFEKIKGFENDMVMTMCYANDLLYVGTNGKGVKVLSLSNNKLNVISGKEKYKHTMRSGTITSLLYDNGILWIGTQFNGLSYNPSEARKFSYYENDIFSSTDYNVRSFYLFPNGDKLIGTRTGLFYVSEKGNFVKQYTIGSSSPNLRSDIILYIEKLNGRVLIGTYGGGVYVFNEKNLSLEDFSKEEPFQYGGFFHFVKDKNGDVWFATSSEGIYHCSMDGKIIKKYDTGNSCLSNNIILYLYRDSLERLWIGTHFGLFLMDLNTKEIHSSNFLKHPITSMIQYIMEDSKKNIWVCTNTGLYKISSNLNLLNQYTRNDFLPENLVESAVEDKAGYLWFSTIKEIIRYDPRTNVYYKFQKMDGLDGYDFNNGVRLADDGTIWWANEGGLIYNACKDTVKYSKRLRTPIITSYSVSGKEYDPVYMNAPIKIDLHSSPNSIRIKFSNMDYSLPYATIYEYMLQGYDSSWIKQEGINEVTYTNLSSGKYIFKLRNAEDDHQEQQLIISVRKSYNTLIWVSIMVILVASFILFYSLKIKKLKKRIQDERIVLTTVQELAKIKNRPVPVPETNINKNMMDELLAYMDKGKPYLNPKLNINEVSAKLSCTASELSQFLNKYMQVNFSYFINIYRVKEIKLRLNEDNLSKYTLKALSEQCGFNSQTTFYRVFKNVTGMTPVEYCKSLDLNVDETGE